MDALMVHMHLEVGAHVASPAMCTIKQVTPGISLEFQLNATLTGRCFSVSELRTLLSSFG